MRGDACEMLRCLCSVSVLCDPQHPMLMCAADAVIE